MFFYQRQNTNQINSTYGGIWNYSTVAFAQDLNAGPQTGASTVASAPAKDMRGGWSDAGDYNKYINFTLTGVIELLEAYRDNSSAFSDNWNLPESGNGVPDLLDEIKYELEWMRKMRNSDGSTHNKMGSLANSNENSPPNNNTDSRYYVYTCPSSAYTVASVFALAAIVFQPFDATYSTTLTTEATSAYTWAKSQAWNNNCDNTYVQSGDGDGDMGEVDPNKNRDNYRTTAALYMYDRTGNATYRTDFDTWYTGTTSYLNNFWDPYRAPISSALLRYGSIAGATTTVANNIRNSFVNFISNTSYVQAGQYYLRYSAYATNAADRLDLYRAYLPNVDYVWVSNMIKATAGIRNLDVDK